MMKKNRVKKTISLLIFAAVLAAGVLQLDLDQGHAFDGNKDNTYYYLEKVDEDGKPVIGATFSIEGTNLETGAKVFTYLDNDIVDTWTTTTENNGSVEIWTGAGGKSKVVYKEIVTPEGYEKADDLVLVMWLNGSTGDWEGTVNGASVPPGTHDPIVIVNKLKKREIKIAKKEEGKGGAYLKGAVLEITGTKVNGIAIDKITINTAEEAATVSLPAGTYTLHEVAAPEGYELAEDITFDVAMDGTVTVDGKEVGEVTMTDKKTHEPKPLLSVKKTSNVKKAKPGDVIPFEITVTNKGDADAEEVIVLDTMGDALSYVSDDSNGTVDGQKISWNVKVAAGETRTININCRINASATGKVINNVEITNVKSEFIEPSEGEDEFEIVLGESEEPVKVDDTDEPTGKEVKEGKDSSSTGDSMTMASVLALILAAGGAVIALGRRRNLS